MSYNLKEVLQSLETGAEKYKGSVKAVLGFKSNIEEYESQGKIKKMFRGIIFHGEIKKMVRFYNTDVFQTAAVGYGISLTEVIYRNGSFLR